MSVFTINHTRTKNACFHALSNRNFSNDTVFAILMAHAHDLPVDREKFGALVKSQLGVDHRAGVRKIIEYLPNSSPRIWLRVLVWPLVVPLRLIGAIVRLGRV